MNETVEIELQEIFGVLLKKVWLIILCAVLLGAMMLAYTVKFVAPQYQATATFYVNNNSNTEGDTLESNDYSVALRLVNSYVDIVRRDVVMNAVADKLGLDATPAQLRSLVSAEVSGETEIFTVTVTTTDPQASATIANTIAELAPGIISHIISGSRATVIDYARVPTGRYSPNYMTSTILGAILGAALAIVAILIQHRLDVHVKSEEMLAQICGVPVLGTIPDLADTASRSRKGRKK